jgi:hypothetical protein
MPFVDMVFDKPTRNATWGVLSIGKYYLSLRIPFTLLVSNVIHTYETLGNEMARLTTECTAQWIQRSCRLGIGAGAGMICRRLLRREHLRKLCSICLNSINRSFALMYGDAG